MFRGSIVALMTPMNNNGSIDYPAVARLIDMHIEKGTSAIVVLGTTGESGTILGAEKIELIKFSIKHTAARVPVILGTGATATTSAIDNTKQAMELGADACLIMAPAYVKPTQSGLYEHFKAIAQAAAIPQILYNVPGRTGCDILPETLAKLADLPNIVGIKEASGDVQRVKQILQLCQDKLVVLSGEDMIALEAMYLGARGVISVTANVAPTAMSEMCQAVADGDKPLATLINNKLAHLHKALFIESNPIPLKWAGMQLGLCADTLRLPLTPLSDYYHDEVRQAMIEAELL